MCSNWFVLSYDDKFGVIGKLEAIIIDDENSELKPTHPYYYQITLYCGLMNASLGYFVIWTPAGHLFLELPFNVELFNLIRNSAKKYFYEHYVKNFFD